MSQALGSAFSEVSTISLNRNKNLKSKRCLHSVPHLAECDVHGPELHAAVAQRRADVGKRAALSIYFYHIIRIKDSPVN